MVSTAKVVRTHTPTTLDTIPFDEAMERYDGQWVLLYVVAVDEHRLPAQVQVVAAGPDEASVCRAFTQLVSSSKRPVHPYYLTEAYRHIRSGDEALRALGDAAAQADEGTLGAWRWR